MARLAREAAYIAGTRNSSQSGRVAGAAGAADSTASHRTGITSNGETEKLSDKPRHREEVGNVMPGHEAVR